MRLPLPIEPEVFEPVAVVGRVHHRREPMDRRLPASGCTHGARINFLHHVRSLCRWRRQVAHLDPWSQYLLLTEPEPLLDGKSIVETLQAGELDRARRVLEILRQPEAA